MEGEEEGAGVGTATEAASGLAWRRARHGLLVRRGNRQEPGLAAAPGALESAWERVAWAGAGAAGGRAGAAGGGERAGGREAGEGDEGKDGERAVSGVSVSPLEKAWGIASGRTLGTD